MWKNVAGKEKKGKSVWEWVLPALIGIVVAGGSIYFLSGNTLSDLVDLIIRIRIGDEYIEKKQEIDVRIKENDEVNIYN